VPSHGHLLNIIPIEALSFTTFKEILLNMKHNIYEFSLFFKILCFVSKGTLNIPEYRCLLIGRVHDLYTIEHAVGNIAYHRFQSISVTLLSLVRTKSEVRGSTVHIKIITKEWSLCHKR